MKNQRTGKLLLLLLLLLVAVLLSGCYDDPGTIDSGNINNGTGSFPEITIQPPTATPPPAPTNGLDLTGGGNTTSGGLPTPEFIGSATQLPGMDYLPNLGSAAPGTATNSNAPTNTPTATPSSVLKLGVQGQGDAVRDLQRKLKSLGFYKGSVDGDFGEGTDAAVKAFQKQYGLTVDGIAGSDTLNKLATAKATAKPTNSPTPKPTATPKVSANTYLKYNDSGSDVKQMQNRLIELNYLAGTATGKFCQVTEDAVTAFQKRNCPYADGIAGQVTLNALYSSSAKKASNPVGTIGEAATTSLRLNDNGPSVRALQSRLKLLGYYTGTVDGDFGKATEEAVKAFQKTNGLTVDGVAGASTQSLLNSSNAKSASYATPTPKPTASPTPNAYTKVTPAPDGSYVKLERNNYGDLVTKLQKELKAQGYFTGSIDSYYGEGTESAVKAFQRQKGLQVDGIAGPATQRVLYEGDFPYGS